MSTWKLAVFLSACGLSLAMAVVAFASTPSSMFVTNVSNCSFAVVWKSKAGPTYVDEVGYIVYGETPDNLDHHGL